ncbi:hypothetical protein [Nakamurella leprariae]|uniref:Uncharacterized protein n=1 Tax=Nakamurella leprariae TaxID=2803911 RepID=A0A939C176_9ACTN|nr:hypothetical protein [Nakamurella leprariae]MBM9469511.1 hypothetical protein [Nakamurella leprariae]
MACGPRGDDPGRVAAAPVQPDATTGAAPQVTTASLSTDALGVLAELSPDRPVPAEALAPRIGGWQDRVAAGVRELVRARLARLLRSRSGVVMVLATQRAALLIQARAARVLRGAPPSAPGLPDVPAHADGAAGSDPGSPCWPPMTSAWTRWC